MDIGLYKLKYSFRKLIGFVLPYFKNTDPNVISWMLLPIGLAMALVYYGAFQNSDYPELYLLAALLGFLRMFVATLDGLVAVTYNKSSVWGDITNRVTPELCDAMLFAVIAYFEQSTSLAVVFLAVIWLTGFVGYVGAPSRLDVQSVGPAGQTDRLAAVMLFSGLQFLSIKMNLQIDFIRIFIIWIIGAGIITILNRLRRVRQQALKAQQ